MHHMQAKKKVKLKSSFCLPWYLKKARTIYLGTRTGNAINYTVSEILPDGNRPGFRNVVLLITDGASQDDITLPSLRLRQSNAVVRFQYFKVSKKRIYFARKLAMTYCY